MEDLIEKAKQDLAQCLYKLIRGIRLITAKEVNCDSHSFEYHAAKSGALTYCENPLPPVEGLDNT